MSYNFKTLSIFAGGAHQKIAGMTAEPTTTDVE